LAPTRSILAERHRRLTHLARLARRLTAMRSYSVPHLRASRNQSIARWLIVIAVSLFMLTAALAF
jgi:hypothetical protein